MALPFQVNTNTLSDRACRDYESHCKWLQECQFLSTKQIVLLAWADKAAVSRQPLSNRLRKLVVLLIYLILLVYPPKSLRVRYPSTASYLLVLTHINLLSMVSI